MIESKNYFFLLFWLSIVTLQAQTIEVDGIIVANGDVENIHVINKSSIKFAITNKLGGFKIAIKVSDTLVFSSVQYKLKAIVVSPKHIIEKKILVVLEEHINELNEVLVGKVLTGDLNSDVKNSDAERPIDFYDVGIPGYTGKPKTQSERRLYEADHGKFVSFGLGVGVNLNKVLNAITGRTKKLKERVKLETNDVLLNKIIANLSEDFFIAHPLDEKLKTDFFYFCSEDENFAKRCKHKSDIEVFEYLAEKIVAYKNNLETSKVD